MDCSHCRESHTALQSHLVRIADNYPDTLGASLAEMPTPNCNAPVKAQSSIALVRPWFLTEMSAYQTTCGLKDHAATFTCHFQSQAKLTPTPVCPITWRQYSATAGRMTPNTGKDPTYPLGWVWLKFRKKRCTSFCYCEQRVYCCRKQFETL